MMRRSMAGRARRSSWNSGAAAPAAQRILGREVERDLRARFYFDRRINGARRSPSTSRQQGLRSIRAKPSLPVASGPAIRIDGRMKVHTLALLPIQPLMNTPRRHFLKTATLSLGSLGLLSTRALAAEPKAKAKAPKASAPSPSFARKSKMKLGTVTYNLAMDWDVPTLIKNCTEAKFEGVELRTSHKHGVEVTLSKTERAEVKKRFADSPVALVSLGSAFDYHTPDQAKLKKDIEATKEYMLLGKDVGAAGVKVRPNALPREVPVEKTLEQIGRSLRELGEFGKNHGQKLFLEVHGTGTSLLPNIKTIMDVANHPQVGVCWNSNQNDLAGDGFDHNFNLVKNKIFTVHMRDLYLDEYPFRKLLTALNDSGYTGFCFAEIPSSPDAVRLMKYYRSLWLAYQNLL
jgi:sugar phosphate isomerase/epimerase